MIGVVGIKLGISRLPIKHVDTGVSCSFSQTDISHWVIARILKVNLYDRQGCTMLHVICEDR